MLVSAARMSKYVATETIDGKEELAMEFGKQLLHLALRPALLLLAGWCVKGFV